MYSHCWVWICQGLEPENQTHDSFPRPRQLFQTPSASLVASRLSSVSVVSLRLLGMTSIVHLSVFTIYQLQQPLFECLKMLRQKKRERRGRKETLSTGERSGLNMFRENEAMPKRERERERERGLMPNMSLQLTPRCGGI